MGSWGLGEHILCKRDDGFPSLPSDDDERERETESISADLRLMRRVGFDEREKREREGGFY